MTTVERLLAECGQFRPAGPDPAHDALRRAIVIEDTLGITLTDEQIDMGFLTDREALDALLRQQQPPG